MLIAVHTAFFNIIKEHYTRRVYNILIKYIRNLNK